jgi:hypothetical protein
MFLDFLIFVTHSFSALKTLHAALNSRISDCGQSSMLNGKNLLRMRPEQLLFTTIELDNCEQREENFYQKVYNALKWEKVTEFAGAFQCSNAKEYEKCELLEVGIPGEF